MNHELTVLIVEDDPHVLLGCQQALALEDIQCEGVSSAEQALARVGDNFPGIVISDIRLPGMDGLELLKRLKARDRSLPVVLITGHGDISIAVGAMRDGAYDFMEKPFSPERLVDVARRALEQRSLAREVWSLRRQLAERDSLEGRIIGRSPAMQQLRELIANVADTSANVLIEGETGTGKELVARCLHDFSRRQPQQFVALNCGGLPENLFESEIFGHEANAFTGAGKRRIGKIEHANGGTLFLDEVESMPINLQIKLLRVLQERTLERLGSNQSIDVPWCVVEPAGLGQITDFLVVGDDLVIGRKGDFLDTFTQSLARQRLQFDQWPPVILQAARQLFLDISGQRTNRFEPSGRVTGQNDDAVFVTDIGFEARPLPAFFKGFETDLDHRDANDLALLLQAVCQVVTRLAGGAADTIEAPRLAAYGVLEISAKRQVLTQVTVGIPPVAGGDDPAGGVEHVNSPAATAAVQAFEVLIDGDPILHGRVRQ